LAYLYPKSTWNLKQESRYLFLKLLFRPHSPEQNYSPVRWSGHFYRLQGHRWPLNLKRKPYRIILSIAIGMSSEQVLFGPIWSKYKYQFSMIQFASLGCQSYIDLEYNLLNSIMKTFSKKSCSSVASLNNSDVHKQLRMKLEPLF